MPCFGGLYNAQNKGSLEVQTIHVHLMVAKKRAESTLILAFISLFSWHKPNGVYARA